MVDHYHKMPKDLHARLIKGANKLGLTGARRQAYIWGNPAMQKYLEEERKKKKKH